MSAGTKEVKYMSEARLDEIKAGSRGIVAKWKVCAPSKVGGHILAAALPAASPTLPGPLVFQEKRGLWEFT